jgi:hypothetical protein
MWDIKLLFVFQYILVNVICNILNSGFNKIKVDDLTHVKILIVQEMWKKSWLSHSNIITKYSILVYYNKCKMKFVNNDLNILIMNGSTLILKRCLKNH